METLTMQIRTISEESQMNESMLSRDKDCGEFRISVVSSTGQNAGPGHPELFSCSGFIELKHA